MTRTELVKKIIRFAGVPEQETKVFMETLLRRLASLLSHEDVFKISGIGAFKVKNLHDDFSKTLSANSNVILFNDDYFFGDGGTELLFGIPESKRENISEVDAVFSMSIGKPIIPLRVDDKADLYSLYSGSEINFIIDSKVEKLINNSEIIRNQFLIDAIPEESVGTETESVTDESLQSTIPLNQIDLFTETDFKDGISWDFGQTWQDEFDENEILNVEDSGEGIAITELSKINDKELDDIYSTWNFGTHKSDSVIDEVEQEDSVEKDFLDNTNNNNLNESEFNYEEESEVLTPTQEFWQSIDDDKVETENDSNIEDSYYDDYKPVKSRTQELNIDLSGIDLSEYDKPEHVYDEEDDAWKRLTNEIEDDSFVQVTKGKENNYKLDDFYDNPERTAEEEEIAAILEAHKKEEKNTGSRFEVYSSQDKFETIPQSDINYELKPSPYRGQDYVANAIPLTPFPTSDDAFVEVSNAAEELKQKGKTFRAFLNVFLILGIISISGYLYYKYFGIPEWTGLKSEVQVLMKKTDSNPVIIERDFEIPVNYPYLKQQFEEVTEKSDNKIEETNITDNKPVMSNENESNDMFSRQNPGNILNQKSSNQVSKTKPNETDVSLKEKNQPAKPIQSSIVEKKISENIFQDGNYYSVQVSSWKAKSKAQSEVARFLKSGRQALLVEAQIPGRGIWYRVRITGFNSVEEAEKFLTQNR
jgi:nucleoid DNA-binding protein/cell division septation protein DedD